MAKHAGDLRYAAGALSQAVYRLATCSGDMRERLLNAFHELAPVTEQDVPPYLRAEFRTIRADLTRRQPRYGEGTVQATLHGMRSSTGGRIARQICRLERKVREHLRNLEQS